MRTILYFIFFYLLYRILRRLIMGPRPKRTFYVNFGHTSGFPPHSGAPNSRYQAEKQARKSRTASDEPEIGGISSHQQKSVSDKRYNADIQDAEFKEVDDNR